MGKPAKTTTVQDQNSNQQFNTTGTQTQDTTATQQGTQASSQDTSSLSSFLNNLMSSSSNVGTTTLSPLQQPVAEKYFQDVMNNYSSGALTPTVYGGERVAGLTPEQQAAQNMATGYATGAGSGLAGKALTANSTLLDPGLLNPENVPGLQASKAANAQMINRNLTENQLPAIRGGALLDNTYGGSRQGIAEGIATRGANDSIANANAGMDMSAYSQGLQAMQGGLGLAPSTYNVGTAPSNTMSQVGAQNQQQQQARDIAEQQKNQEQNAAGPAATLSMLQSLLGTQGQYGGQQSVAGSSNVSQTGSSAAQQIANMLGLNSGTSSGSTTGTSNTSGSQQGNVQGTTTQTQQASTMQNLIAMMGLALMPFSFGMSGPGAAQAAASDRRLKKDIVQIGKMVSGIPLYLFRYVWETALHDRHFGVMADEVRHVPEAVSFGDDGFARVNYTNVLAYG